MHKLKTKLLALITGFSILFTGLSPVFAETDFEPYEKTFIVSAYYSPLPNQRVYFRGSYDADRRLNGNGTNGADGTEVYPGMLAAPKTYSFGIKLEIPGLGVGAIHDRGGAIVPEGQRGFKHDRLDVWMGKGEEGLARALQWGVRTVTAKVYPASHTIAESFTLPSMGSVFVAELKLGDSGELVSRLQEELKTYGYYREAITSTFDENTEKALLGYQLTRNIVASADDPGAGVLGPRTREKLNGEIFARSWQPPASLVAKTNSNSGSSNQAYVASVNTSSAANSRFPVTLSLGDTGSRVKDLQVALTEAGYYECEINGIYNEKMEDCIFEFQQEKNILASRDEFGAGFFGEKTRSALSKALDANEDKLKMLIADRLPAGTSQPGESGAAISKLQEGLKTLGYLEADFSSEYDESTKLAVVKFQIEAGIIESETSYGAGFFGSKTKTAFEKELSQRLNMKPQLAVNPEWNRVRYVAYNPTFSTGLALGDTGDKVEELQKVLQELGYFKEEVTGNFGELTEQAVIEFQIAEGVVSSATEYGAGSFGPKTRAALNAVIKEKNIALKRKEETTT